MPEAPKTSTVPVTHSSATFSPIGELISKSWELVKLSWKNLLILSIIMWVIVAGMIAVAAVAVGGSFALSGAVGEVAAGAIGAAIVIGVLMVIAILVLSSVFGTGMMIAVAEAGQKPSIGSLISRGFKLFLPVFFTSLIMIFVIYGGFFLFVIPGIVIAILTGFSIYEVIFTEHKYMAAIKNSVRIVSQNFGELFVRVLLILGLAIGLGIVQGILQTMVGGEDSAALPLVGLVMAVAQMLFSWFTLCYYFLVYKEARSATDFNRSSSTLWIWIVAVLGWIVGAFILVVASAAITAFMNSYSGSNSGDTQSFEDIAPMMLDESGEVNTEQLLQEYGQDMSEEEKEEFRQMIENAESAMEQDQDAAETETQQPI